LLLDESAMSDRRCQPVICPAAFLGRPHSCVYEIHRGIWKCHECGLGGNSLGFTRLTDLEAERHGIKIELDILRFEVELDVRERSVGRLQR